MCDNNRSNIRDDYDDVSYAAPENRENKHLYTTIFVVNRKRKFYKKMDWLHKGSNLIGVRGANVATVKAFVDAHEFEFGLVKIAILSRPGYPPGEMYMAFNNHLMHAHQNIDMNKAFDKLVEHFGAEIYEDFRYEVVNADEYVR